MPVRRPLIVILAPHEQECPVAVKFNDELKRHNVIRVAVAYAAVAWLLMQVADLMLDSFDASAWISRTLTTFVTAGFQMALLLSHANSRWHVLNELSATFPAAVALDA